MLENELLDDMEDDLVFPETLEETKAAISAMIGDITEMRTWVTLQYEGRKSGLYVDYNLIRQKQEEISALQGDINALKKHASGQRDVLAAAASSEKLERDKTKLDRMKVQKEIEKQAMDAKNDRRVRSAELQARRETAAMTAVDRYVRENCPDHLQTIRALVQAARLATT